MGKRLGPWYNDIPNSLYNMCLEYRPIPRFEDTDKRKTARKVTQKDLI